MEFLFLFFCSLYLLPVFPPYVSLSSVTFTSDLFSFHPPQKYNCSRRSAEEVVKLPYNLFPRLPLANQSVRSRHFSILSDHPLAWTGVRRSALLPRSNCSPLLRLLLAPLAGAPSIAHVSALVILVLVVWFFFAPCDPLRSPPKSGFYRLHSYEVYYQLCPSRRGPLLLLSLL